RDPVADAAVEIGQAVGVDPGQLPAGYLPLPADLAAQAVATAKIIRTMTEPVDVGSGGPTTVQPSAPTTVAPAPVARPVRPSGGASTTATTTPIQEPTTSVPETTVPTTTVATTTTTTTVVATPTTAPPSLTPSEAMPGSRYAIAGLGAAAAASALVALEITKRARRAGGAEQAVAL
ncbi:MAG: hypothetical protein ACOYL9_15840, partial [Ilumatobacteraceae bacterium]